MTKEEDFKLLKIQTCVLRVNIHCDGCKQKVKKILQRIEGVYQVAIDAEQQKVTVSGGLDAAILIKKLVRAGKHAELWTQKSLQNQKQKSNCIKDEKNKKGQKQGGLMKGFEALKNQQKFPFILEEGDAYCEDDEDDDCQDDELHFNKEKANRLNLLRQQEIEGNNGKNGKMNNNSGGNQKGNLNQNMGMNGTPGAVDPKTLAALKMSNAQLGVANMNQGDGRMANNINSMVNLAGFHTNGANNLAAMLGANPNSNIGSYQMQTNKGFLGSSSQGFPNGVMANGQHHPSMMLNMNGGGYPQQQQQQEFNNHPSSVLMNLQNRHAMQQPQMMYNRSPFIPATTGYYYNSAPVPYGYGADPAYNRDLSAATHIFSDENTSSCSIM